MQNNLMTLNKLGKAMQVLSALLNQIKTAAATNPIVSEMLSKGIIEIEDRENQLWVKMKFPMGCMLPIHVLDMAMNDEKFVGPLSRFYGMEQLEMELVDTADWEGRVYTTAHFKVYIVESKKEDWHAPQGRGAAAGADDAGSGEEVPAEAGQSEQ